MKYGEEKYYDACYTYVLHNKNFPDKKIIYIFIGY